MEAIITDEDSAPNSRMRGGGDLNGPECYAQVYFIYVFVWLLLLLLMLLLLLLLLLQASLLMFLARSLTQFTLLTPPFVPFSNEHILKVTAGIPPRYPLFNGSICADGGVADKFGTRGIYDDGAMGSDGELATIDPVIIRASTPFTHRSHVQEYKVVFFVNDGALDRHDRTRVFG